ncbi:MAG: class A beta-lactamase [Myxococcota bacterium]
MRQPRPSTALPLTRRHLLKGALLALPMATSLRAFAGAGAPEPVAALAELERLHGGRLGVYVLDTGTGARFAHRPDERFAMCSTFKLLLSGFVLARADRGEDKLDRALDVPTTGLVSNSPVTTKRAGTRMTLAELCHATMTTSDNTAANLLLSAVGGPPAVTAFARSLGDSVTRLDRIEPELNVVNLKEGDTRDTTTPAAMASLLRELVAGDALRPASRDILIRWMREAATGLGRLRAGLPADWNAGDKTGTGMDGPTNDIAVGWPPGKGPVIVTAYYDRGGHSMAENSVVLAEVGRIVGGLV